MYVCMFIKAFVLWWKWCLRIFFFFQLKHICLIKLGGWTLVITVTSQFTFSAIIYLDNFCVKFMTYTILCWRDGILYRTLLSDCWLYGPWTYICRRFPPGSLASSHSLKTRKFRQIGVSKLPLECPNVRVCACDCLPLNVSPTMNWRLVQVVPRLLPGVSWDRLLPSGTLHRRSGEGCIERLFCRDEHEYEISTIQNL